MNTINLIVTCTSRKTRTPVRGLRLRDLREKSIANRARQWLRKLRTNGSAKDFETEALNLYCGEYWSVVRELPMVAQKCGVALRFWICSAGYGLISPQSKIRAYAATFSSEEDDCVTRGVGADSRQAAARQWWQQMAKWSGPRDNPVRSLTSLAREHPRTPLVVVASSDYLHAIENDLRGALSALLSPDLLLIVSAGTKSLGNLTQHLLPCDARLQSLVGGTRASLNIRIARLLIARTGNKQLGMERATIQMARLLRKQPAIVRYQRHPASDEQICSFIRFELNRSRIVSHSLLLRKFRDSGRACEQSRFANLYRQTVINEKVA
jgi:hypothetical protein